MDLNNIQAQYDLGYPVLEGLFALSDKDLKAKLQSIIGDKINKLNGGLLGESSGVRRTINNEKCTNIVIEFYDWIQISAFGINYHPEHGEVINLIEFTEHFVL